MARCGAAPCTAVSPSLCRKREERVADTQIIQGLDSTGQTTSTAPAATAKDAALRPLPPDAMIIVPVRSFVLFPGVVMPVTIGREKSVAAAQQAVREQRQIGILMQRDPGLDDPSPIDMHRMGTVANVARYVTAPDGGHHLICQGEQRFQ
ncbi:MAG: LON peptidase substrate-binding domain-containing protein, partial [Alphaproteobacteria bacterium]|nr:LON peptidase substrate-binding domain-containing protein [Alphaproteobacteria bacterium]